MLSDELFSDERHKYPCQVLLTGQLIKVINIDLILQKCIGYLEENNFRGVVEVNRMYRRLRSRDNICKLYLKNHISQEIYIEEVVTRVGQTWKEFLFFVSL